VCAVAGFDYEPTGGAPGAVSFKAERTISISGGKRESLRD
jgi:hypothetical protein